ncbi:hypothetical protein K7432_006390 [Basidiobolus ranarum]|uniref:Zn(2)-C6 fungal-type domain-containing protein n=1 Tax=Basidiobolus ranarum TaxID=34480 RepID=A0ABR2W236_9FUNG
MSDTNDPTKRRKFGQACIICRRKKVKCDSKRPTCSNCLRLGNDCVYVPTAKKRNPQKQYIESLERKIELLEQRLKHAPLNLTKHSQDTLELPDYSELLNPNYNSTSTDSSPKPSPQEESIQDTPIKLYFGNTSGILDIKDFPPQIINTSPSSESTTVFESSTDELSLSPKESKYLIDAYFERANNTIAVVHRPTFLKALKNNRVSKILLYSMYALSSSIIHTDDSEKQSSQFSASTCDMYASKVKELLPVTNQLDISTIQALIIITCFEFGRSPSSWIFPALAIRIAQALGINRIDENSGNEVISPEQWIERETRRRIWWTCYMMDRYGASLTGRPLMIDERDCHILLPVSIEAWESGIPSPSQMLQIEDVDAGLSESLFPSTSTLYLDASCSISAVYIVLITILGKITRYINQPKAKRQEFSYQVCPKFVKLDNELQAWATSLPAQYQYIAPKNFKKKRYRDYLTIRSLHTIYHTCVIILHRINLRNPNVEDVVPVSNLWTPSLRRCFAAANAISRIVSDVTLTDFGYFDGFIPFCIFTASTVHLWSVLSMPWEQVIAKTDFALHYWALQSLSKVLPISGKYCHVLKILYEKQGARCRPINETILPFKEVSTNRTELQLNETKASSPGVPLSEPQHFTPSPTVLIPSLVELPTLDPQQPDFNFQMVSNAQRDCMLNYDVNIRAPYAATPQMDTSQFQCNNNNFGLFEILSGNNLMEYDPQIPQPLFSFGLNPSIANPFSQHI